MVVMVGHCNTSGAEIDSAVDMPGDLLLTRPLFEQEQSLLAVNGDVTITMTVPEQ